MNDSAAPAPTILMIDDSEEDIELLTLQLKSSGLSFALSACENTDRAAQFIAACKPEAVPNLIILDLHLPPQNGEFVFRQIRANPLLAHTPVLIMTTSASPTELTGFKSQPHTQVVTKPYALADYKKIVQTISSLLRSAMPHA